MLSVSVGCVCEAGEVTFYMHKKDTIPSFEKKKKKKKKEGGGGEK